MRPRRSSISTGWALPQCGFASLYRYDRMSLDVCSGEDLFDRIEEIYPKPGAKPVTLQIKHPAHFELAVDPWPFDAPRLAFDVPARRVPAQKYGSDDEFRRAYHAAPVAPVTVAVRRA